MDWMFTDTTLALTSWLQMEDIFANVFCIKCDRHIERVCCLSFLLIYCCHGIPDADIFYPPLYSIACLRVWHGGIMIRTSDLQSAVGCEHFLFTTIFSLHITFQRHLLEITT